MKMNEQDTILLMEAMMDEEERTEMRNTLLAVNELADSLSQVMMNQYRKFITSGFPPEQAATAAMLAFQFIITSAGGPKEPSDG